MRFYKWVTGFGLAMALVACGGGGGSAGTKVGSTTPEDPVTVPTAADFIFELDKAIIVNSGGDQALLTVTAVDGNRNTVSGVPVSVELDQNGIFVDRTGSATDQAGKFSGKISIGGDKSNRTIRAKIVLGGITKYASVEVTGTKITIAPVPATPAPGELVTLNLNVADNSGVGIPNAQIVLAGTSGFLDTVYTDSSGNKVSTFRAPTAPGSYTVTATSFNVTETQTVSVISAAAGSVPPAVGVLSARSLTPQPTNITTNTIGSTTSRSKLSAKFLAAGNVGIANMRVRFELVPPVLGNGESISTGATTVYTNASGVAESDYIAGTRTSPTNGVAVRACYSMTDFTSSTACPAFVTANLTVAGAPLSISIGDDNTMEKGLGGISYLKKFLIQVNDSSGVAVKDAVVSASVDITHYGKGLNWSSGYLNVPVPNVRDVYSDLVPVPGPIGFSQSLTASTYMPTPTEKIWCINEDWNRNGFLDTSEDINLDSIIQPRKAEIVVSYVSGNTTDANGQLLLQISYPQNMARWLAYTLRATTTVEGSEGDAARSFVTDALKKDVEDGNGSFLTPPFGFQACNRP